MWQFLYNNFHDSYEKKQKAAQEPFIAIDEEPAWSQQIALSFDLCQFFVFSLSIWLDQEQTLVLLKIFLSIFHLLTLWTDVNIAKIYLLALRLLKSCSSFWLPDIYRNVLA